MTFRPTGPWSGVGQYAATQHFKAFMKQAAPNTSYFAAFEANPGMPGFHVHALLHGLRILRKELWEQWFLLHGRNRIEPILSKGDVVSYCAKYVMKDKRAWWDVELWPHKSLTAPASSASEYVPRWSSSSGRSG